MDLSALPGFYAQLVPFATTLGTEYVEVSPERVVLRLPDDPKVHNHLGGPHAGAQFSTGESASGLVVLIHFSELMGEVTPLPGRAEIRYRKVAKGPVTVTATLGRDRDEVLAEVREKGNAWFTVDIVLSTDDGETGSMTVDWNLKKN
jgi:acyl-coenzyme A thioesterase PaaI-like protein